MVRLPPHDLKPAVNLLKQNEAHQLVRKCHGGEAETEVSTAQNVVGKAEGPPNDKRDVTIAIGGQTVEVGCELFRRETFSLDS